MYIHVHTHFILRDTFHIPQIVLHVLIFHCFLHYFQYYYYYMDEAGRQEESVMQEQIYSNVMSYSVFKG